MRILQARKERGGGVAPRRNNRKIESATKVWWCCTRIVTPPPYVADCCSRHRHRHPPETTRWWHSMSILLYGKMPLYTTVTCELENKEITRNCLLQVVDTKYPGIQVPGYVSDTSYIYISITKNHHPSSCCKRMRAAEQVIVSVCTACRHTADTQWFCVVVMCRCSTCVSDYFDVSAFLLEIGGLCMMADIWYSGVFDTGTWYLMFGVIFSTEIQVPLGHKCEDQTIFHVSGQCGILLIPSIDYVLLYSELAVEAAAHLWK